MLKKILPLLILFYTVIVYWLTVFSRAPYPQAGSDWRLFWTYEAISEGRDELIGEVISNVLMFVPIGVLIGLLVKRYGFLIALILGAVLSLGIELLQLLLSRGLCETDDIIHNTVGCLVAFAMIRLFSMVFKKQGKTQDI